MAPCNLSAYAKRALIWKEKSHLKKAQYYALNIQIFGDAVVTICILKLMELTLHYITLQTPEETTGKLHRPTSTLYITFFWLAFWSKKLI
jgi:hypothetical protein